MAMAQRVENVDTLDELDVFTSQEANNLAQQLESSDNEDTRVLIEHDGEWPGAATIADVVHGTLRLHPLCNVVRFTPHFQRLDRLRQLGVAYSVFPSATHTRLTHSLGVSHLCFELLRKLRDSQRGQLELEERDIRNVALAGLCHDLGHGPLSHVFEREFLRRSGISNWEHEDMSLEMFKDMVDSNGIEGVDQEDFRFIENMIKGVKPEMRAKWPAGKRFLFDIVSNDYTGVDMDRADYLQRDALMCGRFRLNCNFQDLLSYARVVDDQICYPTWQLHNVWFVYSERVRMFREVYTHRRTKAAELMAVDALMMANQALHFSNRIASPKEYLTLNDELFSMIEHYHITHNEAFRRLGGAEQRRLAEAQQVLGRIHRGALYDCCGECEVPERMLLDGTWDKLCKEFRDDVVASYDAQLLPTDIMLDLNQIDYGKGGVDPMAKVGFYKGDGDGLVKVPADLEQLRGCERPSCFKTRTLRVFVRQPGQRRAASAAFQEWCRRRLGSDVRVDTEMLDEREDPRRSYGVASAAATGCLGKRIAQRSAADPRRWEAAAAASPLSPQPVTPASKKCKTTEAANNSATVDVEL
ncbi:hypothetical protein VOLCADRAFT_102651 [Volvox carteri f. nagariensis]|uniref:HD/PDEase domain-containing protein n=1 Tax=Volvox carteri f. nagariensis TaxID=3068 RepID=D8THA3_VOLCA|nr:uncharacterized protein VOLCADRAFT_102651 [Volvox carteri f. nagariensis]EFJ52675.1 hypothetical protein VOLCADRAFT_102651 [Volvox carteri f. nagariensis]|eukprot:XP_002945680.1 hypothetical protein VOLCADRAFT_102651 [Volvox carteri f. nagariensis]